MKATSHPTFLLLSLSLILLPILPAFAQPSDPGSGSVLSGSLRDGAQNEVMYAAVALVGPDSLIVNSAISSPEGNFQITSVAAGTYRLRVAHLEYATYTSAPFTVDGRETKTLPEIVLRAAVNELSEVVVTYRKPLIEVKPDRLVFNVASSPSAAGSSGLDLLRMAPGVTVDLDNNIALLGKSGVQIYLNDVPSRLSGPDLVTMLQNIGADQVESIEVISNPSARYDAEGNAGIINIVLKKTYASGYNGSAASSFTQGRYLQYNNNVSLNYGGEKLKANVTVGQSGSTSFDQFRDTKVQREATLDLFSYEVAKQRGLNIAAGLEVQPHADHLLSFNARGIVNENDNNLDSQTDIFPATTGQLSSILLSQSYSDRPSRNLTANFNHHWTLTPQSSLVSAVSLGSYRSDQLTRQPNTLLAPDATTVIETDDAEFTADADIQLWSAKTDWTKEWDQFVFAAGLKYSHITTRNQFAFFQGIDTEAVFDPTRSNDFDYTEHVAAGYVILDAQLSPALTLSGGLRVERTDSRGQLFSDLPIDNKDVKRNYTDFFPNVSLSFDNQQDHTWSVSIGRRITRPNYQDLNPFETPISQLTVWKGNPFLRPQYTRNYQATYSFRQKLVITNTYSITEDFFASIFEVTGPNSNQIIPRNMQQATSYGVVVSYPIELTKFWNVHSFLQATRATFEGDLEGTIIDLQNTNYNYRMQNNFKLPGDITLDLTYSVGSDWIWRGSVRVRGNQSVGFGLRKYFFGKQLQVNLTGADIFRTTNDYFYAGNYGGIQIDGVRTFDTQRFGLGLVWKFGDQQAKTKQRTNSALDEELNRISE